MVRRREQKKMKSSKASEMQGMSVQERESLLEAVGKAAYENDLIFPGCAQATLDALQTCLGLGNGEIFRAVSAVPGAARNGEVCGAVMGGIMAISLAYGSDKEHFLSVDIAPDRNKWEDPEFLRDYEEAASRAGEFTDRFKAEFGSLRCYGVQEKLFGRSWNTRDPKELEEFHQVDSHPKCGRVCQLAARFAAEVILKP
jgi:hypothetical protein